MSNENADQQTTAGSMIDIEKRQQLIGDVPCFFHLAPDEALELASHMQEIHCAKTHTIVKQGDIIDCIYIISEGVAEIIVQDTLIATLERGEAIGLTATGFFSKDGIRTATVTAATDMYLLRLDITDLQIVMQKHGKFTTEMQEMSEQMLRMAFLKQTAPFAHFSPDKIRQLLQYVGEMQIEAGELIFREGDPGENCYFIVSGKIEIFRMQTDESRSILATLESPMLFGELALLTDKPRNATAQAVEKTLLLTLAREHLLAFMESDVNVTEAIMALSIERGRPIRHSHITVHKRMNTEGQTVYILKDPVHNRYYKLSDEGHFIWRLLDGNHTLKDITVALFQALQIFSPESVCRIIFGLAGAGFVEIPSISTEAIRTTTMKNMPWWTQVLLKLRDIMEKQFAFSNADKILTRWYQNGLFLCYTWPAQLLFAVIFIGGFIAFVAFFKQAVTTIGSFTHLLWMFPYLIAVSLIFVPLHELGHAITTKHFGHEVNRIGVGWYWVGPIAFADTSDMWLADRWPRIIVNLAGMYVDGIIAGAASLIAYFWVDPVVGIYFWLFAMGCYSDIFKNLDPLLEYDGYFALMDYLDRPNLRAKAVMWLVNIIPKAIRHPAVLRQSLHEPIYWAGCVLFALLSAGLVYLMQRYFLFPLLPTHFVAATKHYNLDWLLPSLAILASFMGVWAEAKYRATRSNI